MRRVAEFFHTIAAGIGAALSGIAHAVITIITLPFRAVAKLFHH